jgi:alkaline phosphatase
VKWRNELIALFCLLLFAALGVVYFQYWVIQKPFGIILFVGEGLTPVQIALTRLYVGGADAHLGFESLEHVAIVKNHSEDFAVPDSAAAATAIATGVKVPNRAIAVNAEGKPVQSIVDLAREHGRMAGLVTNGKLTDATSAAFYAHAAAGTDGDANAIAQQLVENGKWDVVMGGGAALFLPSTKGGERQDARDLLLELRRNGFDLVRTRAELESVSSTRRPRLFGVFANHELAFADQIEEQREQPSLSDMVRRAIELLQYNRGGYFLAVDAALGRKAAEENRAERTLNQTAELDRALTTARRYAGARSTIVVCGDVAVGGLALNGFPFRNDSGIALLGLNSTGEPWMSWASGPKGIRSFSDAKHFTNGQPAQRATEKPLTEELEPAAFYSQLGLNTAADMIALGSGRGTAALHGYIDNTQIFRMLRDEL